MLGVKVESLTAEAEALHEETRALTTELMANFQVGGGPLLGSDRQGVGDSMSACSEVGLHVTSCAACPSAMSVQDAMLALRSVEAGDIMEMQNIKAPTADVLRVARAVLLLFGTPTHPTD